MLLLQKVEANLKEILSNLRKVNLTGGEIVTDRQLNEIHNLIIE